MSDATRAGNSGNSHINRVDPREDSIRFKRTKVGGAADGDVYDHYPVPSNPPNRGVKQPSNVIPFKVGKYDTNWAQFEMHLMDVVDEIRRTMLSKQKDYGPNNIRRSPYGAQEGLIVRLYDKVARAANLTGKGKQPENESLRDTFLDIAGYGVIGLMLIDGTFPKEK